VLSTTNSPQIHHDLPRKNHVLRTQFPENPQQKREITTPEKICVPTKI
jgi:hypothetical protein